MDIFRKVNVIKNLSATRKRQLEKHDIECQKMKEYLDECPKEISQFFINSARINKIQSNRVYDSSILQYSDSVEQNLNEKNEELENLQLIFSNYNPCKKLKQYLIKQQKYIEDELN